MCARILWRTFIKRFSELLVMSYGLWVEVVKVFITHNTNTFISGQSTFVTVHSGNIASSLKNWFTASYLIGILLVFQTLNGQSRRCGIIRHPFPHVRDQSS